MATVGSSQCLCWKCVKCGHIQSISEDECDDCHLVDRPSERDWYIGSPEDGAQTVGFVFDKHADAVAIRLRMGGV